MSHQDAAQLALEAHEGLVTIHWQQWSLTTAAFHLLNPLSVPA